MKRIRFIALLLICILTFSYSMTFTVVASKNENAKVSSSDTKENEKENKKSDAAKDKDDKEDDDEEYVPVSKYMLIADLDSGRILYDDGADKEFNPGSLVKILTAITAIENSSDLSKKVSPIAPVLDGYDYESYGNIGLEYDEKMSLQNLIEAMMITDAGDCALTIAHNVGKSYDNFIAMMNETAKKAGATDSVFTDPVGFDEKHQKTNLSDMHKIISYALKNKTFSSLTAKERIEIPATNKTTSSRIIFNTNHFISRYYSLNYYNSNIKFAKTYYNSAQDCGIAAHYKTSGSNLLMLCAKSQYIENNCGYDDVNYLIEYATKNFIQKILVSENEFIHEVSIDNGYNSDRVLLVSTTPVKVKLEKNYDSSKIKRKIQLKEDICAPIKKGQSLGTVTIYYNDEKCGESKLVSYSDIEKSNVTYIKNKIKALVGSWYFKLIIAIILLMFVYKVIKLNRKKKR